jgi:hypothetical protein
MSVSVDPSLCDRCSSMFQGSFLRRLSNHHTSIQSLEQAADKNCIICRDVWKDLVERPDFDRETFHGDTTREGYVTRYLTHKDYVSVHLHGRKPVPYLFFNYVETQRKSACRPSRV